MLCRHILYRVIAAFVVQEGKVLFESYWPAAGSIADSVLAALHSEDFPSHVLHGDVIVLPVRHAFAAAIAQQHCLIAVIAQTQFAYGQLQLPYGAGLRPAGPFSPSSQVVTQEPALSPLPVKQGSDHMLKLALCEALEHLRKL